MQTQNGPGAHAPDPAGASSKRCARERIGHCTAGGVLRRRARAARAFSGASTRSATAGTAALGPRTTGQGAWARVVLQATGQGDATPLEVHLQHLPGKDIPGLDDLARILDEPIRERADVDEAVLVDAKVNEGTERGKVTHHALEQRGADCGDAPRVAIGFDRPT
jgi:hypothetical protein